MEDYQRNIKNKNNKLHWFLQKIKSEITQQQTIRATSLSMHLYSNIIPDSRYNKTRVLSVANKTILSSLSKERMI